MQKYKLREVSRSQAPGPGAAPEATLSFSNNNTDADAGAGPAAPGERPPLPTQPSGMGVGWPGPPPRVLCSGGMSAKLIYGFNKHFMSSRKNWSCSLLLFPNSFPNIRLKRRLIITFNLEKSFQFQIWAIEVWKMCYILVAIIPFCLAITNLLQMESL